MPPLNTLSFYFPNLSELNLSNNCLDDIDSDALVKACPKLRKLDLSYNNITEIKQIIQLKDLEKLSELNFVGNPIDIT